MRIWKNLSIYVLLSSLFLPLVSAVRFDLNVERALADAFAFFPRFFGNPKVAMGATFLLFFMIIYAMFGVGLSKLSYFKKGSGGDLNKWGHIASISASMLAVIGFYTQRSAWEATLGVLKTFEMLSGALLAIFVFVLFWKGWGSQENENNVGRGMYAAAIALTLISFMFNYGSWFAIGIIIMLIAIISSVAYGKKDDPNYASNYETRRKNAYEKKRIDKDYNEKESTLRKRVAEDLSTDIQNMQRQASSRGDGQ